MSLSFTYSFFVGSFFSKTNLASLIGVLVYFISYLPFILVMSLKYEISYASKFALVSNFPKNNFEILNS